MAASLGPGSSKRTLARRPWLECSSQQRGPGNRAAEKPDGLLRGSIVFCNDGEIGVRGKPWPGTNRHGEAANKCERSVKEFQIAQRS